SALWEQQTDKQKMKEIKDVRKDVKARKGQAFLGLPQRKPTGMLKSHTAPVICIHVSAEDNKIFSMPTDNTIKVFALLCFDALSNAVSDREAQPDPPTGDGFGNPAKQALQELPSLLLTSSSDLGSGDQELLVYRLLQSQRYSGPARGLPLSLSPAPEPSRSPLEPHPVVSHKEPVATFSNFLIQVVKVWDFETGILLYDFIEAHGNAGIHCLTFDSSGRGLVTGGRDGCLKIWSYNDGHCLHTLKHDDKLKYQNVIVCYCSRCIIAVGWDRRINVYFKHGQKEDILCVAQCPPILLATSSYDGEIIIWNVISGHMHCKLNTPSPSDDSREANLESAATALMANGPRDKAWVSSMAVTTGDACAYVSDQDSFVHVYDIEEYGLQGPEPQPPKSR
ncbi:hypothetical protein E2I00_010193, partial [Balaenoptera physalus]